MPDLTTAGKNPVVAFTGAHLGPEVAADCSRIGSEVSPFNLAGNCSVDKAAETVGVNISGVCLLYTSPSPRDRS